MFSLMGWEFEIKHVEIVFWVFTFLFDFGLRFALFNLIDSCDKFFKKKQGDDMIVDTVCLNQVLLIFRMVRLHVWLVHWWDEAVQAEI